MAIFTKPEPLNDAELDRLGDFLKSCKGGKAMNVEQLDGFLAALIVGPETVLPSEYNREVFGGEMLDAREFSSLEEANEILGLMMRHWNTIAGTLFNEEVYVPLLLEDEQGVAHGNDWARGFTSLKQLRVFSLGLLQDRNVVVGGFPENEEILVRCPGSGNVAS